MLAETDPIAFVRKLARALIGVETLQTSTRSGNASNRSDKSDVKSWDEIDKNKIQAIRGKNIRRKNFLRHTLFMVIYILV